MASGAAGHPQPTRGMDYAAHGFYVDDKTQTAPAMIATADQVMELKIGQ